MQAGRLAGSTLGANQVENWCHSAAPVAPKEAGAQCRVVVLVPEALAADLVAPRVIGDHLGQDSP